MYLAKFSAEPSARPPEMMILAEVSSGRSVLRDLLALEARELPDRPPPSTVSIGAEPPSAAAGKAGGAHGDDLLGVGRLHRLDGVAGIDRPLEGVGRHHLDDVGDLHHVEQRRDARQHVLAGGGGGAPRWRRRRRASDTISAATGSASWCS